ncbi:apolipoprotein N-acyltransferase [Alkalicaulis satelles]|uniref:Apolipoprotein N-acyltransferase n=1 Tax=Alkalicaulis satelles TaxID=2609175 RepID=A0A5M6ZJR2_9PROT|nr:apolipoprotein N-acyltransferase [Alkalicaulis satelles]KAA5803478.1 apolipoprotein N-acyltransferase [Alkalicaulis satelles]
MTVWRARLRRLRARGRALKGPALYGALFALGAFGVLAHAPFHVQPALIIAYAGLVWALDGARRARSPVRAGFARAWSFAAGQFLAGTWWVANAFLVQAEDYGWLIWAPLILLPGGLALFWGAAGAAYARLAPRGAHRITVFAGAFMVVELARSVVLSGFPWNLPGHVFAAGGAVSQIASIIGAAGLSALVLFAFAAPAALAGRGPALARAMPLILGFVLLAGAWGWGAMRLEGAQMTAAGQSVRVVQIHIDQRDKTLAARHEILQRYLVLSSAPGVEDVSAIVWPEGAVPGFLLHEPDLLADIRRALPEGALLLSGITRAARGEAGGPDQFFNSLGALRMDADWMVLEDAYDKVRLVPFGEGNPVAPLTRLIGFETLSHIAPFYTPGPYARTLSLAGLRPFAPLICYEVIFPRFAPRGADRPHWLVNISNDSWYGASSGPRQHLNQAQYRAVEEGLPLVRAASNGVSGQIDPYGRIERALAVDDESFIDVVLLERLDATPYSLYGDGLWSILFAILLALNSVVACWLNRLQLDTKPPRYSV